MIFCKTKPILKVLYSILLLLVPGFSFSQKDTAKVKSPQTAALIASGIGLTAVSYTGLYVLWYKGYDKSQFHLFDDSKEWGQMDKCGHGYSAYWLSTTSSALYEIAGAETAKSILLGTSFSWIYMSGIEIMDGFSSKWGASLTDLTANAAGCLLFGLQEYFLGKQVFLPKFSYQPSPYARYRPGALGKNETERLLKDYNGQTYWLSANMSNFCSRLPMLPWLNIAAGYSINGFTGGHGNPESATYNGFYMPNSDRKRQYLLSLDVDLRKIRAKNKTVRGFLFMLNCIKIPSPTIEYSSGKVCAHWLYF